MTLITQQIYRLYLGRGITGEITEEATAAAAARVEIAVDLPALEVELEQAMLWFDLLPRHVWLPLSTTVAGTPELVWEDDDGLIPTAVPIPHLDVEDATIKPAGGGVSSEEELP